MAENAKNPKSSLKNIQTNKRPVEPRRVTFISPMPTPSKQPRLSLGTLPSNGGDARQMAASAQNVIESRPIAGEEVFNQLVMLQMKAIALREENLLQIVDVGLKVKRAVLQITEEDRVLYQIDGRLNDYAAKLEAKAQKVQESVEKVEYVRDSIKKLREKVSALRSA